MTTFSHAVSLGINRHQDEDCPKQTPTLACAVYNSVGAKPDRSYRCMLVASPSHGTKKMANPEHFHR